MIKNYTKPYACNFWKGILLCRDFFLAHISFSVGKGNRVKFWHDRWCFETLLKDKFRSLFDISRTQNAVVSEVMKRNDDGLSLNLETRRRLGDYKRQKPQS